MTRGAHKLLSKRTWDSGIALVQSNRTKPERILQEIASESIQIMAQVIQELEGETIESVKDYLKNLITIPERKDELIRHIHLPAAWLPLRIPFRQRPMGDVVSVSLLCDLPLLNLFVLSNIPFSATNESSLHHLQTLRRVRNQEKRIINRLSQTSIPNSRCRRTTVQRSFIFFGHRFNHNRLSYSRIQGWFSRSIMVSHDLLPDGSVIRSQNQNGSCSSNGASLLPLKWKPRNVSAVRDFPPGCGPIVHQVNVSSQEANPSSSLVNNTNRANDTGTAETQVESLPNDVSNPTEDGKKILKDEISGPVIKEPVRKMNFPQRRVSAVRDFPPYCGLNATEPTKEERLRINGKRNLEIEDKSGDKTTRLSESNGSVKDEILQKTQSDKSNKSLMENQEPIGDKVDERSIENQSETASQIIKKVCQDLVVYTRDNELNKRSSIDAYDEDSEGNHQEDKSDNSETHAVVPIRSVAPIQDNTKNIKSQNKKVSHKKIPKKRSLHDIDDSVFKLGDRSIVLGIMAPSLSPKVIPTITPKKSKSKKVKPSKESKSNENETYKGTLDIVVRNEEHLVQESEETEKQEDFPNSNSNPNSNSHEARGVDVALPPFGPRSSNSARNRIRETLRLFQALCRKLTQGEEAKESQSQSQHVSTVRRVDLAARSILQEKGKAPDRGKKTYGSVPGVEVGDEFQYRVELALVGLHWPLQGGIDYIKQPKTKNPVAVSVVASGGYDNELNKPDCLIYSGAGGIGKDKQINDQKLERGNIALKNNITLKIPVRVIRGYKGKSTDPLQSRSLTTTYIYDGLYTVEKYWQETGPHGNLVFKFELQRIPGQPELAVREVKSKKFTTREGLCVPDITNGKETIRIPAYNTLDDEKPPFFNYITKLIYPDNHRRRPPPTGCDCLGRCSGKRCACAAKNGGEIPYNHNGAIVEAKPLVYECGPACKCGPGCYNRVTQHGMKIQLELFKTETRGWGVRSLTSISSGSFICEYVGELLEDTEAEKRTGNDEYLFDIGQNYNDCSLDSDVKVDSDGFTIDAANYGNVGRFINHSCSPNLYAQNVLYDEDDKRMPHIMLFAAENIPPLQELTYHYNYAVDTVHDSDGNIKVKKCFCGSSECTGRLY
ncbi:hypothetical protein L2E82_47741 [Cichorium intybus]|uniref:Uncharacterized protein n=1 Tax=Cichorium intybus TaxID=13427 RepID=A0ACB8YVJ3_CICIN|nr:hypothetical protein L2E82_47741 [Cichorium intybus]